MLTPAYNVFYIYLNEYGFFMELLYGHNIIYFLIKNLTNVVKFNKLDMLTA